jgi:hypothetical protein
MLSPTPANSTQNRLTGESLSPLLSATLFAMCSTRGAGRRDAMKNNRLATALLSTVFLTSNAAAADRCTASEAVRTLKVAELQEQLMVAALTCHDVRDYNRFVLSYRPELQASDRAMLHFFMRQDGAGPGDRAYNAFKTRLANVSALNSNADNAAFCGAAADAFNQAFEGQVSLAELAMSEPAYVPLPIAGCSDAVETAHRDPAADDEVSRRSDVSAPETDPRQARAGYDMPDQVYRDDPPPPRDGVGGDDN